MLNLDVWGRKLFQRLTARNDNDANWLNAKALYDEAHEHLRLYETLYARAHAIDLACRRHYTQSANAKRRIAWNS